MTKKDSHVKAEQNLALATVARASALAVRARVKGETFHKVIEYKGLLFTVQALSNGEVTLRQGDKVLLDFVPIIHQAIEKARLAHADRGGE